MGVVNANAWTLVTGIYRYNISGNSFEIFVNGESYPVTGNPSDISDPISSLTSAFMGRIKRPGFSQHLFKGLIDEVRILNTARNESWLKIKSLFHNKISKNYRYYKTKSAIKFSKSNGTPEQILHKFSNIFICL